MKICWQILLALPYLISTSPYFFVSNNIIVSMVESVVSSYSFSSDGCCLWWLSVVAGSER